MPKLHVKFKHDGERFGVQDKTKLEGNSLELELYKYDGNKWHHLDTEDMREMSASPRKENFSEDQLERWGRGKASWFTDE